MGAELLRQLFLQLFFSKHSTQNPPNLQYFSCWEEMQGTRTPEGVFTDEFLSRKPGFLLSAMHSPTFRWVSAAPPVFLFLGFLLLQLNQIWRIFSVMYGEEGGWTLFVWLQKLYISLTCLNVFFAIFNFDNI